MLATAGPLRLDVTVTVDLRPYRDFTISVDAGAPSTAVTGATSTSRAQPRRGRPTSPTTSALVLVHGPGEAHLVARVGSDQYDTRVGWPSEAQLANLVRNVRGAADRWRASASGLLDDLDPAAVDAALAEPLPTSWRDDPGPVWPEREERWQAAAGTPALRELASHGRALYDVLFPIGRPRAVLDAMEPGSVLAVSWTAAPAGSPVPCRGRCCTRVPTTPPRPSTPPPSSGCACGSSTRSSSRLTHRRPSVSDSASPRRPVLRGGRCDGTGGDLAALVDGRAPAGEQPRPADLTGGGSR